MRVEVIAVGDEMVTGQRLDTNSQWLSLRLSELGLRPTFHSTVGDDLADNVRVFREAADRADLIVCSGGLGPTDDDLVREALAQAAGVDLVLDETALAHIEAMFARRKREMPPKNRVQALFPDGSHVIVNPHGTAPGIRLELGLRGDRLPIFVCLPGVPAEMKEMWTVSVVPHLSGLAGGERRVLKIHRVKCFGVGESDLEARIPEMIRRGRDPLVGITVHDATITLRILAEGPTESDAQAKIDATVRQIHDALGPLVFGSEDEELEHAVLALLRERNETLSVVEWGTEGLATMWLCRVDPRHERFRGSQIVRRRETLGRTFPAAFATPDEAIDLPRDVKRVAEACRAAYDADWTLLIGPVLNDRAPASGLYDSEDDLRNAQALDDPASARQGYAVLCRRDGTELKVFSAAAHPAIVQPLFAKRCLNWLRTRILEESVDLRL